MPTYPQFRRSIDVMKKMKDTVTNQLTTTEKQTLIACLKTANCNYIGMSVPLATNAEYLAVGTTPSPRTSEAEWLDWANVIHAAGLGIIFRPAFPGMEGIWNFPQKVGTNRYPAGTLSSVTGGDYASWCGKQYQFIVANPSCFNDSGSYPDVWAPAPERTDGIFSDSTAFLPNTSPGIQQNFVDFYNNLALTAHAAFVCIGRPNVLVGDTANNYSEVRSGWIPQALFDNASRAAVDYYLNYNGDGFSAAQAVADIDTIYGSHGKRVAWQEYGPMETYGQPMATRAATLRSLFDLMYSNLVLTGKLEEFNLWGGWEDQNTSIVNKTGSGAGSVYTLNELGLEVQRFFDNIAGVVPLPTISSFTGTPTSSLSGQTVTLAWSVANATSLSIDQGIGSVTGNSVQATLTHTTTYTLTAVNVTGSVTHSVTVVFDPTPPTPTTRLPYSQKPVFGGVWTYGGTRLFFNHWTKVARSTDNSWTKVVRDTSQ
jgi:hypothetical protein